MRVFYFGAHQDCGPLWWAPGMHSADRARRETPWGQAVAASLCPGYTEPFGTPARVQVEGRALLHQRDGWSALAFWDRSADRRYGSCSVFVAEGEHSFDELRALAEECFPEVWARLGFEVREAAERVAV